MQPPSNKLAARKRPYARVKKREELIPCEDNNFDKNLHNKTRKKTSLNLYIIGKLWIDLLSRALVGEKIDITTARATQTRESVLKRNDIQPQIPKIQYQSSIIKYKDLPVYRDQNIVEYDEETDGRKFFAETVMRLQNLLEPRVSYCRMTLQKSFRDVKTYVLNELERRTDGLLKTREKFRDTVRDPDKLPYRYTAAATGGITGYLLGASGGIPRRVLFTSIGLLSTGVVCFPREADNMFKKIMYGAARTCVYLYNTVTDEKIQLRRDSIEMNDVQPNTEVVKYPTIK